MANQLSSNPTLPDRAGETGETGEGVESPAAPPRFISFRLVLRKSSFARPPPPAAAPGGQVTARGRSRHAASSAPHHSVAAQEGRLHHRAADPAGALRSVGSAVEASFARHADMPEFAVGALESKASLDGDEEETARHGSGDLNLACSVGQGWDTMSEPLLGPPGASPASPVDALGGPSVPDEVEGTSSFDCEGSAVLPEHRTRKVREACGCERHCGMPSRWACLGLALLSGAVVASVVLVMIFVATPRIAQSALDKSRMSLGTITLSEPADGSVRLTTQATLQVSSPLAGEVLAADAELVFEGGVVGTLRTPAADIRGGHGTEAVRFSIDSTVAIQSVERWNAFSTAVVQRPSFNQTIRGTVCVRLYLLGVRFRTQCGLRLEQTVTLRGMAGLGEIDIVDFDLVTPQGMYGEPWLVSTSRFFNPSQISVSDLGVLTMHFEYDGSSLAGAYTISTDWRSMDVRDAIRARCSVSTAAGEWTTIALTGPLQPADRRRGDDLLARYIAGLPSTIDASMGANTTVDGSPYPASSVSLMEASLEGWSARSTLQGPQRMLSTESVQYAQPLAIVDELREGKDVIVPLALGFANPFSGTAAVTYVAMNITAEGGFVVGGIDTDLRTTGGPYVVIAPQSVQLADYVKFCFFLNADLENMASPQMRALEKFLADVATQGFAMTGAHGAFGLQMGTLELDLFYDQIENSPSCASTNVEHCQNPPPDARRLLADGSERRPDEALMCR